MENLFKLPQITTRSQAKIKNSLKRTPATEKHSSRSVGNNVNLPKRITRSVSSNCLQTKTCDLTRKSGKEHIRSIQCGDSGYGSTQSRDCDSVSSRESSISESLKSLEGSFPEEDISDIGSVYSPPECVRRREKLPVVDFKSTKIVPLIYGSIMALIPSRNISNHSGPFELTVENNKELSKSLIEGNGRIHRVGSIVSLEPHGIEFFDNEPAILIIPLKFEPRDETWLTAVYSNTSSSSPPHWQKLPRTDFAVRNKNLVIFLRHFSLFTVVEEEPFPEIMKKIRCRTGGRLRIPDVPGIEVNFPRGCLEHDIDACLRVLFDSEPLNNSKHLHLASPIISLGPHGLLFNEDRLPVQITLPIPEYSDIISRCPGARLVAFQSSIPCGTEPMVWQRVLVTLDEPKSIAYRHGISGLPIPTVTFPVHHFSFFKVVWELLSSTLYEAKMGVSYFYPYISFSMMCQAFMEESHENNRFGLEVICYRSDRKLPETTNYRHRVGASLKPKLVRPGRITVRLRSQMFEADVEAGEETDMTKEEPDFRGRDFEKQYACRFKPDQTVERGPFGKVIVERISTRAAPLFEFNLHKTGIETIDNSPAVGCERWTVFAMKELASSLQISEGNNWKTFAKYIGFTKSEIKNKLSYSPDPFLALMNMYNSRGGTPEEFIQALYVVSRDIRLGISNGTSLSPSSGSSRSSKSNESGSMGSGSQDSASPMKRLWGFRPWAQPLRDSESAGSSKDKGRDSSSSAKRKLIAEKDKHSGGSATKRQRFSDPSEEPASSSSENDNDVEERKSVSTEKHKKCSRKLNDRDLWRISSGIARKDWRNLGRSIGIEERVLGDLEHSHQGVGFRECAYQMLLEWKGRKPKKCTFGELYSALLREKMNSVAKFMVKKISFSADSKEDNSSSD